MFLCLGYLLHCDYYSCILIECFVHCFLVLFLFFSDSHRRPRRRASVSRPEAKALRTGGAALRPAKLREMNGEDATHFGFDDFCQVLEGNIIYDTASAAIPATSIIFVGCCKQG